MPNLPRPPSHSEYLQPSPRPTKKKSPLRCWKGTIVTIGILCLASTALSTYCIIRLFQSEEKGTNFARSDVTETKDNDRDRLDIEEFMNHFVFNNVTEVQPSGSFKSGIYSASDLMKLQVLLQAHDREIALIQALLPIMNQTEVTNQNNLAAKMGLMESRLRSLNESTSNNTASLTKRIVENSKRIQKLREDYGWIPIFNGYEYLFERTGFNFNDSRKFCQSKGGDLATVGMRNNVTRKYLMETLTPTKTPYSVWIGLTDQNQEGNWTWIDGVRGTITNTNFATGEPNNYGVGQDCAYFHRFPGGYKMADYYCSSRFSALCERRMQ